MTTVDTPLSASNQTPDGFHTSGRSVYQTHQKMMTEPTANTPSRTTSGDGAAA